MNVAEGAIVYEVVAYNAEHIAGFDVGTLQAGTECQYLLQAAQWEMPETGTAHRNGARVQA